MEEAEFIRSTQRLSGSCMDERVGPQRKLSAEELMLLNCGVGVYRFLKKHVRWSGIPIS